MEDALENLSQSDWDVSTIPNEQDETECEDLGEECYYRLRNSQKYPPDSIPVC